MTTPDFVGIFTGGSVEIFVDDVVEILSCELIGVIPEDMNIITSTNKGE